jgi:xanthine dehydrogenase accessory factor
MTKVGLRPRIQSHIEAVLAALSSRRGAVLTVELPPAAATAAAADRWRVLPAVGAAPAGDELAVAARAAWLRGEPCLAGTCFIDPLLPPPRMVVAGGGHIGRALADLGAWMGWEILLIDSRPDFADPAGLPETAAVRCGEYGAVFGELPLDPWTSIIAVTPGYQEDAQVLSALASRPDAAALPYVGVIGSKRRLRAVRDLVAAAGAPPAFLADLHAPIGLDVGAKSPRELALAIVAELLMAERDGSGMPVRDLPAGRVPAKSAHHGAEAQDPLLWRSAADAIGRGEPVAMACVVEAKGSAPRRPGARMLVQADGRILGSTGGGVGEGLVLAQAMEALRTGLPRLVRVDLTHEAGSGKAGICGGYQRILVEPLRP